MIKKALFGAAVLVGAFFAVGNFAHAQTVPPPSVRYIKVQVTNSEAWVIFNEVQVYGANGNQITIPASNITVSSNCMNTGGYQCDSSIAGLVDGNPSTGWNAGDTAPGCNWGTAPQNCEGNGAVMSASFTIDLGSVQPVFRISLLAQNTPDPADGTYTISGSTDNVNFTTLGTMSGNGVLTNGQWIDLNPAVGAFTVTNSPTAPITASNVTMGPPTASLTVNGSSNINVQDGTPIVLSWNSSNADGAAFTANFPTACDSYLMPPAFGTGIIGGGPTPPLEGSKFVGQYGFPIECNNSGNVSITYTVTQQSTGLTASSTVNINLSTVAPTVQTNSLTPVLLGPGDNYQGVTTMSLTGSNNDANSQLSWPPALTAQNLPAGITANISSQAVTPQAGTSATHDYTYTITLTGSASVTPGIYPVTFTSPFLSYGLPSIFGTTIGVTTSTNQTCTFNNTCNNTAGSAMTYVAAPPTTTPPPSTTISSGPNVITSVYSYNFTTGTWGTSAVPVGYDLVLYSTSTNAFSSSNNTIAIDGATIPSAGTYQSTSQINVPLAGIAVGTHTVTVTTASGATGSAMFSIVAATTTTTTPPPAATSTSSQTVTPPPTTTSTNPSGFSNPNGEVNTAVGSGGTALSGILGSLSGILGTTGTGTAGTTAATTPTGVTTPASCPGAQSASGFPITVTVTASVLNVRSAPNASASLAGSQTLSAGDTFVAISEVQGDNVEGSDLWWESCAGNYVWAGGTVTSSASGTGTSGSSANDAAIQAQIAALQAQVASLESELCTLEPGSTACSAASSGAESSSTTSGSGSTAPGTCPASGCPSTAVSTSIPLQVACWSDNGGQGTLAGGAASSPCYASGCAETQINWDAGAIGGTPSSNQYTYLNASGMPDSNGTPYLTYGYTWKWSGDPSVNGVTLPTFETEDTTAGAYRIYPAPGDLNSWVTSETNPPSTIPATITVTDAAGHTATASCSAQYPGSILDGIPTLPAMSASSMSYYPLPAIAASDMHTSGFATIVNACQKFVTGNPIVDQDLVDQVINWQNTITPALINEYPAGYFDAEANFLQACKNNATMDLNVQQNDMRTGQSLASSTNW